MFKRRLLSVLLVGIILLIGCSQASGKEVVNSSNINADKDEITLRLESDNFKFYSKDQDKACLEDLSKALEDNYSRITNDLAATLDKKVDVYIYSDLNTFHKAIYQPDAPNWVVGTAIPGSNTIKMVNPSNADGRPYSYFMKVIVHEFTHVVVSNISSNFKSIPIWLNEGIAVFEAEQHEGVNDALAKAKSLDKYPTMKDLEIDTYNFGNNGGYQFSYSIVEYIINNHGYEKLVDLIKSPSEFEKILGLSKEEFQRKWVERIN